MDISKIVIKGLFGELNHEIDLSDSIAIIMGDNGVGKTAVLNIMKAIYDNDFNTLLSYNFQTIEVSMKSKKAGRIFYTKENKVVTISSSSKSNDTFSINQDDIECHVPPYFRQSSQNMWFSVRDGSYFTTDELCSYLGKNIYSIKNGVIMDWYSKLLEDTQVKIITTQRLYQFSNINHQNDIMRINTFSKELVKYISSELSNAGKQSAELDRTFPTRLVKRLKGNKYYKVEDLIQNLARLEDLRIKLAEVGFLDKIDIKIEDLLKEKKKDRVLMNVIKLYIEDSQEKLEKYKIAADKANLFLNVINSRFKGKKLRIDTDRGFVVTPLNYPEMNEIPIDQLSSGEQNEIVLFYDLIFNCDKCSIVLIDEPEISLHLEWLQKMLEDFKEIVKQNGMKMLIATHSPDFVGDNYDMVQNLNYYD